MDRRHLFYREDIENKPLDIRRVDCWDWREGERPLLSGRQEKGKLFFSPDGERGVMIVRGPENKDVLIVNGEQTFSCKWLGEPLFSADGSTFAIPYLDEGYYSLFISGRSPDIAEQWKNFGTNNLRQVVVHPNGDFIAAIANLPDRGNTVVMNGKAWETRANFLELAVSNDGEKILAVGIVEDERGRERKVLVINDVVMELEEVAIISPYSSLRRPEIYEVEGVQEFAVGEKNIAVIVDMKLRGETTERQTVIVNGQPWSTTFLFCSKLTIGGGRVAVVAQEPENFKRDIVVDGQWWGINFNRCEEISMSANGRVGAIVQEGNCYMVVVDGQRWPELYAACYGLTISHNGESIAVIAKKDKNSKYSVVVNGTMWEDGYLSCSQLTMNSGGEIIAVIVEDYKREDIDPRHRRRRKTIAVNGQRWEKDFQDCQNLQVSLDGRTVVCAVNTEDEKWGIAVNGELLEGGYDSIEHLVLHPDGKKVMFVARRGNQYYRIVRKTETQ